MEFLRRRRQDDVRAVYLRTQGAAGRTVEEAYRTADQPTPPRLAGSSASSPPPPSSLNVEPGQAVRPASDAAVVSELCRLPTKSNFAAACTTRVCVDVAASTDDQDGASAPLIGAGDPPSSQLERPRRLEPNEDHVWDLERPSSQLERPLVPE